MFQITGRWASRLVVPTSSTRPLRYSCAIRSSSLRSTYLAIRLAKPLVSAKASAPNRPASTCGVARSSVSYLVQICCSRPSYSGPRKANGAVRAPALTPVTTSDCGRSHFLVQPASSPAAKAPSPAPPEIAKYSTSGWPTWREGFDAITLALGMCTWANARILGGTSSPQKRACARPGMVASDTSADGTGSRTAWAAQPASNAATAATVKAQWYCATRPMDPSPAPRRSSATGGRLERGRQPNRGPKLMGERRCRRSIAAALQLAAVVGSMVFLISVILVAGKPLISACL